jgi:hypothetical protein
MLVLAEVLRELIRPPLLKRFTLLRLVLGGKSSGGVDILTVG